jgi:hypothetical protein
MVIGATVGAALILLVVVAEACSGFLWHEDAAPFHCSACDLHYARYELGPARRPTHCPHGHPLDRPRGFSWTIALSTACLTVVGAGLVQIVVARGA